MDRARTALPSGGLGLMADEDERRRFIPLGGHFDPVGDDEASALGHALLAQLRGEPLSPSERALLARSRSRAYADARAPAPVAEVSETLATFERGPDAELRVSWRRFKGSSPFLDLRRWERAPREGMRPTRHGITLRARELSRMMSVLVQALHRVSEDGPSADEDRTEAVHSEDE